MNYHCEIEIQSCTNEDIRFHGLWALEVQNIDCNNDNFKKEHILPNQLKIYGNNPSYPKMSKHCTGEKVKKSMNHCSM